MASLAGKVAVITGASKGIGKATALALATRGASIVVNYSSDSSAADAVVDSIGAQNAVAIKADVSTISGVEQLIQESVKRFGKIDILIPNAGVLPMKDLEHTTEQDFDNTFNLNVKGPYFLCQVSQPILHFNMSSKLIMTRKRFPICQRILISSFSRRLSLPRPLSNPHISYTMLQKAPLSR